MLSNIKSTTQHPHWHFLVSKKLDLVHNLVSKKLDLAHNLVSKKLDLVPDLAFSFLVPGVIFDS